VRDEVASKIKTWKAQFPRFSPQLAVVQVGARQDSTTYVRMKAKACEEVDIRIRHVRLPAEATVDEVVEEVRKLNEDEGVSGILVQLPLGSNFAAAEERLVTETIRADKDVDG